MATEQLLNKYDKLGIVQSKEDFNATKIEFVYHSNRLEGSNLTLLQTQDIINTHKSKGESSLIDGLMAIDNYRALDLALTFGANKYPLDENMVLNFHKTLLKNSFEVDPFYISWKEKGQKLGDYKVKSNRIKNTKGDKSTFYSTPSPKESREMLLTAIESYNLSSEPFLEKLSKLIQNIYNAHAFFDGNKRMTRLIMANQLMANGFPLMVLHQDRNNYNEALIDGFLNNTNKLILEVITKAFNQHLSKAIEENKETKPPNNKGFGIII